MWGGIAGAIITLWVTFAPCFLWIFAARPLCRAPWRHAAGGWRACRNHRRGCRGDPQPVALVRPPRPLCKSRPRGYGPAAPWIPDFSTLDPWSLLLSLLAALALLRFHWGSCRPSLLRRRQAWQSSRLSDSWRLWRIANQLKLSRCNSIRPYSLSPGGKSPPSNLSLRQRAWRCFFSFWWRSSVGGLSASAAKRLSKPAAAPVNSKCVLPISPVT